MNAKNINPQQTKAQKERFDQRQNQGQNQRQNHCENEATVGKSLRFVGKCTTSAKDASESPDRQINATASAFTLPHVGTYGSTTAKAMQSSPKQNITINESTNDDALRASRAVVPWKQPRVVFQTQEKSLFRSLYDRLAEIPTRSKQSRQKLLLDIWSGQHWLELTVTDPNNTGILMPISSETAVSLSIIGHYRTLNPSVFIR